MRSRPFRPIGLPIYVARVPAAPFARCPTRSLAPTPRHFTLITRTARARASYLAALPSTRAIPDRDVFYACHDVASAKAGRSSHSLHCVAPAPAAQPLKQRGQRRQRLRESPIVFWQ